MPRQLPQHRPQTSLPLQGQLETPACEEPTAQGVFFVLHETLAPALRAKVLYIATVMVTKLPSAKTKSLSVCWGGNVSWGEVEGVLLPCPLQNFPQKLQARMPINANWDFFICGHVSIRNLIDRLRQVTHLLLPESNRCTIWGPLKGKYSRPHLLPLKPKSFATTGGENFTFGCWTLDVGVSIAFPCSAFIHEEHLAG